MRKSGPLVGHILILASNGAKIGAFRWAVYGSTKKIKASFLIKNVLFLPTKQNMQMKRIKILTVRFNNTILREELSWFRGAVLQATEDSDVLFHNHQEEGGLRYSYPLIQYKRINQKAAIVCLEEGADVIGQFFSACNFDVSLGERQVTLEVESVKAEQHLVQIWDGEFAYHIRRWLPLNHDNYEAYCQEESLAERCAMLERLLTANILSFAKGIGIHFDEQVVAKITQLDEPRTQYYKGVRLLSFDAEFKTNVSLPDYIGLGKGVSLGMGTVTNMNNQQK